MNRVLFFFATLFFTGNFSFSQSWKPVGIGIHGFTPGPNGTNYQLSVASFCVDSVNNFLYAGGWFDSAGFVAAKNIARWDGNSWSALGSGVTQPVSSIAVVNGDVFVANYSNNKVRKWNGTAWITLPAFTPANCNINSLIEHNGELYAGGNFYSAVGSPPLNSVARWNGIKWDSLGAGIGPYNQVMALCSYQGKVVAAGLFQTAGGDSANNIAIWDGLQWDSLGGGLYYPQYSGYPFDLYSIENRLYASGNFIYADEDTANGIAMWNGTNWNIFGSGSTIGVTPWVDNVIEYHNSLIAHGAFISSLQDNIVKWNNTTWESFNYEEIYNGSFFCLDIYNNELYVGGSFYSDTNGQVLSRICRRAINPIDILQTTCNNLCNGNASGTATGVPPQTYQWSNGETTETIIGLCPGNYSVTVTDSTGSQSFGTSEITSQSNLSSSVSITNTSCISCNDGGISVSINGAVGIPFIQWSTSDTTFSLTNLSFGNYSAVIQDSLGCIINDTFFVSYSNSLQLQSANSTCFNQCDAFASVESNGIAPFTFQWSNGESTDSIGNLCAGIFFVTVTDSNGVSAINNIVISEPSQITLTDTITNATCQSCPNGTATINATGGSPPFSYSWSNGATSSTVDSLTVGTYYVIVTDINNCEVIDTIMVDFDSGINQFQNNNSQFTIFPNPVSDELTIQLNSPCINCKIEITNTIGVKISSQEIKSSITELNIKTLPSGVYFIKLQTQTGVTQVKKFVKK